MVHALKECWRVLIPGGKLVDLHPRPTDGAVYVVSESEAALAGQLDTSPFIPDYTATNESLAQVERERWFALESNAMFDSFWYWDSVGEMQSHVEERWTSTVIVPEGIWERAERLTEKSDEEARMRYRDEVLIARYRKLPRKLPH